MNNFVIEVVCDFPAGKFVMNKIDLNDYDYMSYLMSMRDDEFQTKTELDVVKTDDNGNEVSTTFADSMIEFVERHRWMFNELMGDDCTDEMIWDMSDLIRQTMTNIDQYEIGVHAMAYNLNDEPTITFMVLNLPH